MKQAEAVWGSIWSEFLEDKEKALKETNLHKSGFSGECYQQIIGCVNEDTKAVLETGCGTGRFIIALAQQYPNIQFEGSDISPESVALATAGAKLRDLNNVYFYVDDLKKLEPRQKSYDLIFNEGSVEHFKNGQDLEVMNQMYKYVNTGGQLLIGVPNYHCYVHTINKKLQGPFYEYGYEKSYKEAELVEMMKSLSLDNIECRGVGYEHACRRYGFPYTLVAKKFNRLKETDPAKAEQINNRKGFFIFAKGQKN